MEEDLLRILMLPPDSNFKVVRKQYIRYKREKYFYSQEKLKSIYRQYCKKHQQEYRIFIYERVKLVLKTVFGLFMAIGALYFTYLEEFEDITQLLVMLFCSSIFFCWGWGIEAATMVNFEKLNSIPIVGLSIYIILKITVGLFLGVIVVGINLYTLFKRKFSYE